ncbi:MAG: molybdate ABC transporter substrate-binding protein [Candidatus Methylumidiphilus sp.]
MPRRLFKSQLLPAAFALCLAPSAWAGEVTVYAAASLTNALGEVAKAYEADHAGVSVKTSFAASGALAKQIEAGAPADVFIAADGKWMDYLDGKGKIDHDSRLNLLGNDLALIAPKGQGFAVRFERGFDFANAFTGKLCTGETGSVPVGVYAKEALGRLGWWEAIKPRLVGTDDVRAALDLVGRGECVGIVYATDAKASDKVEVLGLFPGDLHAPIVYPAALLTPSGEAREFFEYLQSAAPVFAKYGFKPAN